MALQDMDIMSHHYILLGCFIYESSPISVMDDSSRQLTLPASNHMVYSYLLFTISRVYFTTYITGTQLLNIHRSQTVIITGITTIFTAIQMIVMVSIRFINRTTFNTAFSDITS